MSRLKTLLFLTLVGVACQPNVTPPPVPPPPVPPPPPANHPPVAVVGGPYNSTTGEVTFDGSASSDSDGDALTYAWSFGDGTNGTGVKPSHTYANDGDYNVSLIVRDTHDAASAAAGTTARIAKAVASVTLVGAGNIASCGVSSDEATAKLIDQIEGTVVTLGDNAFENGTDSEYVTCYGPTWGRALARTRAVLGNHEYQSGSAAGAFDYYGDKVGPRDLGYYSFDIGAWHVIVLNDNSRYVSFAADSPQGVWLAADLAANTKRCTMALWHIPLFLSSETAGYTVNPEHKTLWDRLQAAGVDVVLNGHQHHYERFAPMLPDGTADPNGIREFNVGTGGGGGVVLPTKSIHPNSQVRGADFGVLKLTLKADSYDWQFVPVAGASFQDSGTGSCH